MSIMESMMERMVGRMSPEDRRHMMSGMMEHFFEGMTVEDRQSMMAEMMPKMMEGINMAEMMPKIMMGMMPGMAGGGHKADGAASAAGHGASGDPGGQGPASGMHEMMVHMMPQGCRMMLPRMPREARTEFVLSMVDVLLEQGIAGLSDEEKDDFIAAVMARVTGAC